MTTDKTNNSITSVPSLFWRRALPFDVNDEGYHIFEVLYQSQLFQLQVLIQKEGRLWKTDWALATSLRPPRILAERTVKTRLRPKQDMDCVKAKEWAKGYILSPLALLANSLAAAN